MSWVRAASDGDAKKIEVRLPLLMVELLPPGVATQVEIVDAARFAGRRPPGFWPRDCWVAIRNLKNSLPDLLNHLRRVRLTVAAAVRLDHAGKIESMTVSELEKIVDQSPVVWCANDAVQRVTEAISVQAQTATSTQ